MNDPLVVSLLLPPALRSLSLSQPDLVLLVEGSEFTFYVVFVFGVSNVMGLDYKMITLYFAVCIKDEHS